MDDRTADRGALARGWRAGPARPSGTATCMTLDPDEVQQDHAAEGTEEHRRQVRKAAVASIIGTTIEWYDYFLYGTAAALVFPARVLPGLLGLRRPAGVVRDLVVGLRGPAGRRRDLRPLG